MITRVPKVLALSYYDGATEGFFDEFGNDQVYYFKMLAWDQNQDKRLYVFGRVARIIYLELLDILLKSQPMLSNLIWTPVWQFSNDTMESRANEIVEIGKQSICNPAFLGLGDDMSNVVKIMPPMTEGLIKAIALVGESAPGRLEDWAKWTTSGKAE